MTMTQAACALCLQLWINTIVIVAVCIELETSSFWEPNEYSMERLLTFGRKVWARNKDKQIRFQSEKSSKCGQSITWWWFCEKSQPHSVVLTEPAVWCLGLPRTSLTQIGGFQVCEWHFGETNVYRVGQRTDENSIRKSHKVQEMSTSKGVFCR